MPLRLYEKKQLAKIKTTKKQARQIKRRNKVLLKVANEWIKGIVIVNADGAHMFHAIDDDLFYSGIGCPHCHINLYECSSCEWGKARPKIDFPCMSQKFCGISAKQITVGKYTLKYSANEEELSYDRHYICEDKTAYNQLKNIIKFIEGHIEWANLVITGDIADFA